MRRAKTLGLAGAAALLSTASLAADLAPLPYRQPVPVAVEASGWYLRSYIGAGNQFLSEISHPDFATAPSFTFLDKGGFDSAPFGRRYRLPVEQLVSRRRHSGISRKGRIPRA